MANKDQTPKRELSAAKRAERVLISQGMAIGLLRSFSPQLQGELVKLCSADGTVSPHAPKRFKQIRDQYYRDQKAVVDSPPTEETSDDEPDTDLDLETT
jgi:hypothetical protein